MTLMVVRSIMRSHLLPMIFIMFAFIFLVSPISKAYGQSVTEYIVQINQDNSASWTIIEASNTNNSLDTWLGFQERINDLVIASSNQTQRNMSIDPNSFQMTLQEASVNYQFTWLNFSTIQPGKILFGDIFGSANFFNKLYGEGIIQVNYPPNYIIQSAYPTPNQRDDSQHTLEWLDTQSFATARPAIILLATTTISPSLPSQTSNNLGQQFLVIVGTVLAAIVVLILLNLYLIRRRKRSTISSKMVTGPPATLVESEEEKIMKIIRSNGGQVFQSAVTEQSKFSKAKASQLLTALEKKGVVTRYKKGRDKIVTLKKKAKDESP